MRLINADALEKTLRDWARDHWTEAFTGDDVASEFADMIERAETIDINPTVHAHWIPTSEKLPDELAEVNVTWENTEPEPYYDFVKGHCFTGTAVYFRGRWYWYSAVCVDYLREYGFSPNDEMDDAIKVIAWMPLPESWRGGQG